MRLQPGTAARGDTSLPLGSWGRAQPVWWLGVPIPERMGRLPAAPGHGAGPLPSPRGSSCPRMVALPGPSALFGLSWGSRRGSPAVPLLFMAQGMVQPGTLCLICMALAKPRAGAPPALWGLPYFISISMRSAWVEIGKMSS